MSASLVASVQGVDWEVMAARLQAVLAQLQNGGSGGGDAGACMGIASQLRALADDIEAASGSAGHSPLLDVKPEGTSASCSAVWGCTLPGRAGRRAQAGTCLGAVAGRGDMLGPHRAPLPVLHCRRGAAGAQLCGVHLPASRQRAIQQETETRCGGAAACWRPPAAASRLTQPPLMRSQARLPPSRWPQYAACHAHAPRPLTVS